MADRASLTGSLFPSAAPAKQESASSRALARFGLQGKTAIVTGGTKGRRIQICLV